MKDNQPTLSAAISEFFDEHFEDDFARIPHRRFESDDQGHGRKDQRYYSLAKLPADFPLEEKWPGLKAIGVAVRVTQLPDGSESCDVRRYVVSRYMSGKRFAEAVRGHWGIENSLHWALDVNFNEDQSRARCRCLADNLSWLRRFAVGLLRRHPGQESLKCKMKMAGWSNDFLVELLEMPTT